MAYHAAAGARRDRAERAAAGGRPANLIRVMPAQGADRLRRRTALRASSHMEADMTEVIDREGATATSSALRNGARRVYVEGSRPDIRVPFCEVSQSATHGISGDTPNPPLRRYDTSGAHGDPEIRVAPETGLPPLRRPWVLERGDVEATSGAGGLALRGRAGAAVTQLHYARRGRSRRRWSSSPSARRCRRCWSATRWRAGAPSSRPTSTIPSPSRWPSAATSS